MSTPTRPVVITMKDPQDRNIHILDGTTVENKGKLILTVQSYLIKIYKFDEGKNQQTSIIHFSSITYGKM